MQTIICQNLTKDYVSSWLKIAYKHAEKSPQVVVDCAKLSACDSAGLAALIVFKKHVIAKNKTCNFLNLPQWVTNFAAFYGTQNLIIDN